MTDAQVDILTPNGAGGFVGGGTAGARLLANNMDPGALRPFIPRCARMNGSSSMRLS